MTAVRDADIVERLRDRADSYDQSGPSASHTADLLREAADEIERLRAALRVNGLRWGHTDAEIDAVLEGK
jgi:hypothetical protein